MYCILTKGKYACRSKEVFYSSSVQTIFKAAGLEVTVKETQHRGHATDIVRQLPLGTCDALVTVGGDGTVFEALQVLPSLPPKQAAIQKNNCCHPCHISCVCTQTVILYSSCCL